MSRRGNIVMGALVAVLLGILIAVWFWDPNEDNDRQPRRAQPSETDVALSPSPRTQQPPTLSEAAKENSDAGIRQFVRYYFDVMSHAGHTGDTATLASLADPLCTSCREILEVYQIRNDAGLRVKGGEYSISDDDIAVRAGPEGTKEAIVSVDRAGWETVGGDGKPADGYKPGKAIADQLHLVQLIYRDGSWKVLYVGLYK